MMKNVAKFTSDGQTLTIVAAQGKKGFNVKASVKTGSGKGAAKAVTGCRETFKTVGEAVSAMDKLKTEATKRGWTVMAMTVRNAFSAIPAPAKAEVATKSKK